MNTRCGTCAIAGRPNVGKSTLLNRVIGQKLSITAHKPQTTRHSILGIHTEGNDQVVYVDTPGIHVNGKSALNQVLNRTASSSLFDVDVILFLVQAMVWSDDDQRAWEMVCRADVPFYMVINKVDKVTKKAQLLPFLAKLPSDEKLKDVMIISAKNGSGVDALTDNVKKHLPQAPWMFDEDELTDRSSKFLAAEAVREPLTRLLTDELPARLKEVGSRARESLQKLFGVKIHLELWVRVKDGWADDERALRSLGFDQE